jgi:predicted DNA-binding transcriptional regulator AlpA
MIITGPDLLGVKEIASILKKAKKTIYNYFETGIFPQKIVYRIGNSPRIERQDLYRFIESMKGK